MRRLLEILSWLGSAGARWPVVALALLAAACGEPVVGSDYRGEPLFSFEGRISLFDNVRTSGAELRASVFWSPSGVTDGPLDELVEQTSLSVGVEFPAAFRMNLFHPPPDGALSSGRDYGVGVVLVYDDRDGDGRLTAAADPPELVGGAPHVALLYAPSAVAGERSPTRRALPPGFALVPLSLICEDLGLDPGSEARQECGVPLGSACESDADCGAGGRCLDPGGVESYPGGYCVLLYEDGACAPVGGVWLGIEGVPGVPAGDYWFRSCEVAADCGPRNGYECAPALDACLPVTPIWLEVNRDFEMNPLCAEIFWE